MGFWLGGFPETKISPYKAFTFGLNQTEYFLKGA
jgi:hypothetical protein